MNERKLAKNRPKVTDRASGEQANSTNKTRTVGCRGAAAYAQS